MIRILLLAGLLLPLEMLASQQQPEAPKEEHREQYPFFTDAESRLISDFYRPGSGHPLPVAAKRDSVQSKPLARGGTLPAALEKSVEPFPKDLERRITVAPAGYRRVLYGGSALLVQDSTRLIVDALDLRR